MIELEYDIEEADLAAFFDHHVRCSPVIRKQLSRDRWILLIAFLALAAVLAPVSTPAAVVYGFIAVALVLLWPSYKRWQFRRGNLRHYRAAKNLLALGRTQLKLDRDAITTSNEYGESRFRLQAVERIENSDSHAFVYVGALMAIVVPRAKTSRGDYDAFLRSAHEWWRAAAS